MQNNNMNSKDPVSTIMSATVVVAHQFHNFTEVLELFSKHGMHHLPIVDGKNHLIGIISSNDFLKVFSDVKYNGVKIDPEELDKAVNITDLMTAHVVTVAPTATIEQAAELFAEHKFQAMPVVKDNEIVGILSSKDVMRLIAYF